MVEKVDLIFHYGGQWVRKPYLIYSKRLVHKWEGYETDFLSFIDICREFVDTLGFVKVKQLLVTSLSGCYYILEGDDGIRALQQLLSSKFNTVNLFAVDGLEDEVSASSIIHYSDPSLLDIEAGTDCSDNEPLANPPESSDYDSEGLEVIYKEKDKEITEKLEMYKELHIGMSFKNLAEAKKVVGLYAIANRRGLKVKQSDRTRLRYICQEGCPFKLFISRDGKSSGFRMKTLNDEHTCDKAFETRRADAATLGQYFKRKVQHDPKYKVSTMKLDLENGFKINVSESKMKRVKKLVLEKLDGSYLDDYNKLEAYAEELRRSNPGTDVVVNISKDALAEGKRKFLRLYTCFQALKEGWKGGLRPLIGFDGTFLRGKCPGQLLVAVAQDSVNHFYPLAWAIVDKETTKTWIWFLELLKISLDLKEGEGITFMSDMQKGLLEAVRRVCPLAHQRFCVRHIESNWCKRWPRFEMKKYMWWSAWSTFEEEFHEMLGKIGEMEEDAAKDLVSYPPKAWCRAYFDTQCKNNMVDNNFTESFNSWILEARYKPIIKMLEDIRVMNMLRTHEEEAKTWKGNFSPHAINLLKEWREIAQDCELVFNGDEGYEVTQGENRHTVNIVEKKCTCRKWDLTGIPCPHAIKALLHRKIDPVSEIHWYYSKDAFLLVYKHKLLPVRGEQFWKALPQHAMEPPGVVSSVGRPRKKRIRQKDEDVKRQGGWTASRKGLQMSCGYCSEPTHNIRRCPLVKGKHAHFFQDDFTDQAREGSPQAVPMTGPLLSQESEFIFMPTPGMNLHSSQSSSHNPTLGTGNTPSQSSSHIGTSNTHFHSSSHLPTQFSNNFSSVYDEATEDEPDPILRPKVMPEESFLLQQRQMARNNTGTKKIKFTGDHTGVSEPKNLPYSPKKLTWQGKAAMTSNQLEVEKEKRIGKLTSRRGRGKAKGKGI